MRFTFRMLVLGLASSSSLAAAVQAQSYGAKTSEQPSRTEKQEKPKAQKSGGTVMIGDRKVSLSSQFTKAYQELLTVVNANDTTNFPAKFAAAQAAAATPEERYLAAQLQLKAASAANNEPQMGEALETMVASGLVPQTQQANVYLNIGKIHYNQKQYAKAAAAFEKVTQIEPGNQEAVALLAQSRSVGGNPAEAVAVLQKTIAQQSAGGAKAPEDLYRRAISTAYKAKLPSTVELARQWVAAYPSPGNWSDAIGIYRNLNTVDDATTLDLLRLSRAAGALKSESDYDRYAYAALAKGYPGEAKAVLEEGVKAGVVNTSKSPFKEEMQLATQKSAGEAATLDKAAQTALAGTARNALTTGDLLYGYGRYDKAAELYRAALTKSGADTNTTNLHLGMALARAGDKAGATAALNAVTGPKAEVAKYWLAYLASRP